MKTLRKLVENPSGWDSMANYAGEIPDAKWHVVLTRNRDSDILTESNWETALDELGGESEENGVEVFHFGHWACGWWEALCVAKESPKFSEAEKIVERLDVYPVLNEDDFYNREMEEANRVWQDCYDARERVEYVRNYRNQFEFHDFKDLMACIRGQYFAGYASELIN